MTLRQVESGTHLAPGTPLHLRNMQRSATMALFRGHRPQSSQSPLIKAIRGTGDTGGGSANGPLTSVPAAVGAAELAGGAGVVGGAGLHASAHLARAQGRAASLLLVWQLAPTPPSQWPSEEGVGTAALVLGTGAGDAADEGVEHALLPGVTLDRAGSGTPCVPP